MFCIILFFIKYNNVIQKDKQKDNIVMLWFAVVMVMVVCLVDCFLFLCLEGRSVFSVIFCLVGCSDAECVLWAGGGLSAVRRSVRVFCKRFILSKM